MKTLYLQIFFFLFLYSFSYAQELTKERAEKIVPGSEKVLLNPQSQTIKFIQLKQRHFIRQDQGMAWLKKSANLPTDAAWVLLKTEKDQLGYVHQKYVLTIQDIPAEEATFTLHIRNGLIESANGEYPRIMSLNTNSPRIGVEQAIEQAKKVIPENRGDWHETLMDAPILVAHRVENGFRLAYKIDIYSAVPLSRKHVYIDAITGDVLAAYERIHDGDVPGTAVTKYNGTKTITTDLNSGIYRLREIGRGGGINTYDLNNSTSYSSAVDFTDADNFWDVTTNQDNAAYDAHYGAEASYDYYFTKFGRNSYDNLGAPINSYVHYSSNYVNAFWDGSRMTYGDGDLTSYTALTSIEVVGHEITHAVTEHSAGLIYSYQSGALNESFSDIFGVVIDYYSNPSTANFLMGDQISLTGTPFRSMSNPNAYGDPDTYLGTNWYSGSGDNGGVHTNSGVQNYWFYLLVNGGSGTNDIGNVFNVTGIGMDDAAAIAYRNLTVYLSSNSQYTDARYFAIQAAVDLFGPCSPQVIATTNAWYAVGVGAFFSNQVTANFNANATYSCTVPATINFINQSANGTSYIWNFGDGTSSTQQNPTHTYNTVGTYTVSLITNGSATCGNTDTVILSNYITVTNVGGPISATCNPATTSAGTLACGIFNFTFATINKSSNGGTDGYRDYTCTNATSISEGLTYPINVTTGNNLNENVRVWIDLNNDGQFNMTNELVFISDNKLRTHSGQIIIPGGAVLNTPLRMRVASDRNTNLFSGACVTSTYGQYEDYGIVILPNVNPPLVDFTANKTVINTGETVNFTDLTQNLPTSWNWSFPGGTPSVSNAQHPSITYNTLGNYSVTLIATNALGTDTVVKTAYIQVINSLSMCSSNTSTSTSSLFYDSGGPNGNYSNNQNCSLLINPICQTPITLSFTAFNLESGYDYLKVYDGTSATGTLLLSTSGTTVPASVTANSGTMFIQFTSDGSVVRSGWAATWNSATTTTPPVADFTLSDTNPPLNTSVTFTDMSTNIPNAWHWDFGDGSTSQTQNPQHSYLSPGIYNVRLIVDNCYSSDTIIKSVTVQGAPVISVIPEAILANLECGTDSLSVTLTLYNTGSGDLVVTEVPDNPTHITELLALTYGVDYLNEYTNTINAINQHYTDYNLTEINTTSATALQTALVGKDVLLIPEQEVGTASVFTGFATVLQNYVSNGGTVIFCGTSNSGCIVNTGLLSGNYTGNSSSATLTISDPSHVLVDSVTSPLTAANATFYYNITNTDKLNVVTYGTNSVVCERPLGSGKVIYVGFDYFAANANASRIIANAVRSVENEGLAQWIDVTQITDTISPGDSTLLTFYLNSTGLMAGVYRDTLVITSNDLLNSPVYVPVELTVTGQPNIHLTPNVIDFDTLYVGATKTDTLIIENQGCEALLVSSFFPTNASFSVNSIGLTIPSYSRDTVLVTFTPVIPGIYTDTIFALNNDTLDYVLVHAVVISPPIISTNPLSLAYTAICTDSMAFPLTIHNSGSSLLHWDFFYNPIHEDDFESGNDYSLWNSISGGAIASTCGTAAGSGAMYFNGTGTRSLTTNNLNFSTGGQISFSLKFGTGGSPCESADSGENVVLEYSIDGGVNWILINTYLTGSAYASFTPLQTSIPVGAQTANTRFRWRQLSHSGSGYDNWALDDISIGYQGNSTGLPWASVSQTTGNTPASDSTVILVTLNSTGLPTGLYNDTLYINSNDPLNPIWKIPLALTVITKPIIRLIPDSISFESLLAGTSDTYALVIENVGCDTLFVSSFLPTGSSFSVNVAGLTIPPYSSDTVLVTFSPALPGTYADTIFVVNNDTLDYILVYGTCYGPPIISTDLNSLSVEAQCSDTLHVPLTIYNTGGSVLNWENLTHNVISDDFDTGVNANLWSTVAGGTASSSCGTASGTAALYFNGSGVRALNTIPLNTSGGGKINFYLKLGNGFSPCETPDPGDDIVLEYSVNGGVNWALINTFFAGNFASFTFLENMIPSAAQTDNTIFRWRQLNHSGAGFDNWSIDQVTFDYKAESSLADWVTLSQNSGVTSISDSTVIDLIFNSSSLTSGVYRDTLLIHSNDPANPLLSIPIEFSISNLPKISVTPDSIAFGILSVGASSSSAVVIENLGCDTLFVSSFASSDASFSVDATTLVIPPLSNDTVLITFNPTAAGTYSDTVFVFNNDTLNWVLVSGVALDPPVISSDQLSFTASASCADSILLPLTIYNTGGSDLTYQLDISASSTWLNAPLNTDTLAPSDSVRIDLLINRSELAFGVYRDTLLIHSNDPANPLLSVPIEFTNTDQAKILVTPDSIAFGILSVGASSSSAVVIENLGCDTLFVSSFASSDASFSVDATTLVIPPFGSDTVLITFNPTAAGTYSDTVFVFNNDTLNWVLVSGVVLDLPVISSDQLSLTASASCADSILLPLTIYNTGGSDLTYQLDISASSTWLNAPLSPDTLAPSDSVRIDLLINRSGLAFGVYRDTLLIHSNDPANPLLTIPIEFTNTDQAKIFVTPDSIAFGILSVGASASSAVVIENLGCDTLVVSSFASGDASFSVNATTLVIPPLSNDTVLIIFNPTAAGTYSDTVFVFNNDTLNWVLVSGVAHDLPVISSDLLSLTASASCADSILLPLTIYNTGGSDLTYQLDISASSTWLNAPLNTDTLAPSDSVQIDLLINRSGLAFGVYRDTLLIHSNDPANPLLTIPIEFTNTDQAKILVTPDSIAFGILSVGASSSSAVVIENLGCDTLVVSSFASGDASFSVNATTLVIPPLSNDTVLIIFNPTAAGTYSDTVFVFNNDTLNWVLVSGVALDLPVISSDQLSLTASASCADSILLPLTIYNTGGSDLTYQLDISASSTWLDASLYTDTVAPLDSTVIWLTFRSAGMAVGVYTTDILIHSNDPSTPTMTIPCNFQVLDGPCSFFSYSLPDTCGNQVDFTTSTINTSSSWNWDFGDGQLSTVQHPSHTYAAPGSYTVQLIVCDAWGCDTLYQTVTLNFIDAQIAVNPTGIVGNVVDFSGSSDAAASWIWDFGDGYLSNLQHTSHSYASTGNYSVSLTVTNTQGCQLIIAADIQIEQQASKEVISIVEVFPNPSEGQMTLINTSGREIHVIAVYNALGQLVYYLNPNPALESHTISLPDLSSGIYDVRVLFTNDDSWMKKILIKR